MSRPARPLTSRVSALAVATLLLVAGCGSGGSDDAPTTYVLTDLNGGTAPASPVTVPTTTPEPTTPPTGVVSAADLVARIGEAVGAFDSVHVSGGDDNPPPVLESDQRFGGAGGGVEFDATLSLVPDQPVDFRLLAGSLYVDAGSGFELVDPSAPGADAGLVPAMLTWNPLVDLRDVLLAADTVTEGGPDEIDGVAVTSYTFSIDTAAVAQPSTLLPGAAPDTAQVTVSLDADDLPVRLDLDLGSTVSRVGYSDWGAPVEIDAPDVG